MEIIYDKQFWIAIETIRPLLETHKITERKIGFMVKEKIAAMFREVSLIENIALASNRFSNIFSIRDYQSQGLSKLAELFK